MKCFESNNQLGWFVTKVYFLKIQSMTTDQKTTDSALSKAMRNPLAEVTKKSDVADVIWEDKDQKLLPNQISPQLDKFENSLIKKKKFNE